MKTEQWKKKGIDQLPNTCIIRCHNGGIYNDNIQTWNEIGKQVVVINFCDEYQGESWNPLSYIYGLYQNNKIGQAIIELQKISHILFQNNYDNEDPYWMNMSSDFFTGLSLIVMKEGNEETVHMGSVRKLIEESLHDNKIINYVESLPMMSSEFLFTNPTLKVPRDTKLSILSVMQEKLNSYIANPVQNEMISKTTFDITNNNTYYVVIANENSKLADILVEQLNDAHNGNITTYVEGITDTNEVPLKDYPIRKENIISYIELPKQSSKEDTKIYRKLIRELENIHTFDATTFMKLIWEAWNIQDLTLRQEIYQKLVEVLKLKMI